MSQFLHMLFWLVVAHALCDFPLQGDFLAKAKNHVTPVEGVPSWMALFAHAAIHAGAVAVITRSVSLGCMEFLAHALIDWMRCAGVYSFAEDQTLHIFMKLLWAAIAVMSFAGHR